MGVEVFMDKRKRTITLIVFFLGIFIGAVDTGIVSPSRTVIQQNLNITDSIGVWMITIYTLVYAVSMPIVSKLSDIFGRKKVYLISIAIFTIGSIACGLTNFYTSFPLLLCARVVQAIGGGGIIPIATAYIGTSFPKEKRGAALGLVGAVYGIATILGPTLGSTVIDIAGAKNWGWIFFINVPISIVILILGFSLQENEKDSKVKLDLAGAGIIAVMVLSLMYAMTNLNFFTFTESIKSINVWPYLALFFITLPIFIIVESKARDPVMNIRYFKNPQITITLILGLLTGIGLMGIVFVPQFAENVLKLPSGKGGYLVTIMSLFAGVSAPFGGRLVDKFSAKLVIITGFLCTAFGTGFLALVATQYNNLFTVFIGLIFIGLGIGFVMGTPLNYLMLSYVDDSESASGIATLSLIRSLGIAISPNILVNFISQAGQSVTAKLKAASPAFPYPKIDGVSTADMSKHFDISKMSTSFSNLTGASGKALDKLKESDVTTITNNYKGFMNTLFDSTIIPNAKPPISDGLTQGIAGASKGADGITSAIQGIDKGIAGMNSAISGIDKGVTGMHSAVSGIDKGITGMNSAITGVNNGIAGVKGGIAGMQSAKDQIVQAVSHATQQAQIDQMNAQIQAFNTQISQATQKLSALQAQYGVLHQQLGDTIAKKATLAAQISSALSQKSALVAKLDDAMKQKSDLNIKLHDIMNTVNTLTNSKAHLTTALSQWKTDYLTAMEGKRNVFDHIYQTTMNGGFKGLFLAASIIACCGFILALFLKNVKKDKNKTVKH
jgi:EmrB/QacA subfamily drug resistance transporter